MKIENGKLFRPGVEDLDLIKMVDEIYESGHGEEFEQILRGYGKADTESGRQARFDPSAKFYVLYAAEVPKTENLDIFRRLCRYSPSGLIDVETSTAELRNVQLVEQMDFVKLIRAIMQIIKNIFGFGEPPVASDLIPRRHQAESQYQYQ